jgi:NIMA-interacting peptidyl-prolyl cis-trans isomerase 1
MGDLGGWVGKGDMQKEFEDAAFQLKPGEGRVVETASGLHLIERYFFDVRWLPLSGWNNELL